MRYLFNKPLVATVLALASLSAFAADKECPNCFAKRWVYFAGNLTLPAHVDLLRKVIGEAEANGYNGIALTSGGDGAYSILLKPQSAKSEALRSNLASLVELAASKGIELIPVGGGPEVPKFMKPELVEALPATTSFTVRGNVALVSNRDNLADGDGDAGDAAGGWRMDAQWVRRDQAVAAARREGPGGAAGSGGAVRLSPAAKPPFNSRLYRRFDLAPHKAYRLTFRLKASERYPVRNLFIQILAEGKNIPLYRNVSSPLGWGTKPDGSWNDAGNSEPSMLAAGQDWRDYELTFNTGNYSWVQLYFANQKQGDPGSAAWVDDIQLHEVGLSHPVRRASLPLVVKGRDGTVYKEGSDYVVGVEKLTIPDGSRIRDGQELTVSWYQSGENLFSRWNTAATACTDEFFDIQKAYYDQLHRYFGGKVPGATVDRYFMYYDEIRVMNWDPGCRPAPKTAGEYLARMVNGVGARLKGYPRPVEKLVWNDMFDRQMNAVPQYWQVNGDLSRSSVPLDRSFVVVNWAGEQGTAPADDADRKASLAQFAAAGHRQVVALYYDRLPTVDHWLDVMSRPGAPALDGVMYTTWVGADYAGYAHLGDVADKIRARFPGRWPAKQR